MFFHFESNVNDNEMDSGDQETEPRRPSRTELGNTPSTDKVMEIFRRGKKCANTSMAEDGWNNYVHQTVLELAIPSFITESDDLVRHILW